MDYCIKCSQPLFHGTIPHRCIADIPCPFCAALRARIEVLERFLADNADYDGMKEKDQEWFIENVHKKYYPENY